MRENELFVAFISKATYDVMGKNWFEIETPRFFFILPHIFWQ